MKKFYLLVVTILLGVSVYAQRNVTGKVVDEAGEGLIGASVTVKGSTTGTITDFSGNFNIEVPDGNNVLLVTYTGFLSKEVSVEGVTVIDVVLQEDIRTLDEFVVLGYGTEERRNLTGSVTSIDSRAIENLISPSFESQLAGRAAGVMVTTPSGILGQAPIVRIRGVNSITSGADPLYVIDGVPVVDSDRSGIQSFNPLANINPQDIASFEVLKDGSATAIFGSRAANGVIIITTKRGSEGAAKVSYGVSVGSTSAANRFDLLNGSEFVTIANEKRSNAGATLLANESGINTDWQDYVLVNGISQQHNLSISGGTSKTNYFMSLGFSDQAGIVRANDMTRYSFRANLDHKVSSRVRIGTSLSYSYTELNGLNNGANSLSGATLSMTRMLPNVPIFDEANVAFDGFNVQPDGTALGQGANSATVDNNLPNIAFVLENNVYRTRSHRLLGNVYGEIDIVKNLTARTQIGVDATLSDDFLVWNPRHGDGRGRNGYVSQAFNPATRWNWQNTLNFQKIVALDHSFNITAGMEYQKSEFYNFFAQAQGFSDEFYTRSNLISGSFGDEQFVGGGFSEVGFDSYFGRINYAYQGRYLASFSIRNDGISSLALANRRGTFMGGSVGWRISDEAFFTSNAIDDLKLRVSYAEVGNTEIGAYPYAGGFAPVLYGTRPGIAFNRVDNTGLQWETSKKINIGLDLTIGSLNLNLDVFQNDIDNLVLAAPVPVSLGIPNNQITQNIGAMVNRGVEIGIGATILNRGGFTWSMDFNLTLIENEVLRLVDPITGTYNRTEEGMSIAQLYGFQWAGVNSANGNPMYFKGDGSIVQYNLVQGALGWRVFDAADPTNVSTPAAGPGGADLEFLGNTLPTFMGGWTNRFSYKGFDLEIFLRYSGGNYIMNESRRGQLGQGFSNNSREILDRWTESGQQTDVPKLYSGSDGVSYQTSASSSRFVEKGDFLRIQNIVLGYRLPRRMLTSVLNGGIAGARAFIQVQNLATFTSYTGLDPELNQFAGQLSYGVDWNVTPLSRTWSAGVNIDF